MKIPIFTGVHYIAETKTKSLNSLEHIQKAVLTQFLVDLEVVPSFRSHGLDFSVFFNKSNPLMLSLKTSRTGWYSSKITLIECRPLLIQLVGIIIYVILSQQAEK